MPEVVSKNEVLEILKQYIVGKGRLLEVGSHHGEVALFFAPEFPEVHWITSEAKEKHFHITKALKIAGQQNVHGPETYKVGDADFPKKGPYNYILASNVLQHISWKENKTFFKLLGKRLREGSLVFFHGPFLDEKIQESDAQPVVRHFKDVASAMEKHGLKLLKDYQISSEERLLVFERLPFAK